MDQAGLGGIVGDGLAQEPLGTDLVAQVKDLCRSDPGAKAKWCAWCDANAEGTKDPARMAPGMLEAFFAAFAGGNITIAGAGPPPKQPQGWRAQGQSQGFVDPEHGKGDLAEVIKTGQRFSSGWKTAWVLFCQLQGVAKYDPTKHSKEFLLSFLELLGSQATLAMGGTAEEAASPTPAATAAYSTAPAQRAAATFRAAPVGAAPLGRPLSAPDYNAPPAKRPRNSGPAAVQHAPGSPGEQMVLKIKELQRTDPVKKQQWSDFCDTHAQGVKDPSRHEVTTLQMFFDYAV